MNKEYKVPYNGTSHTSPNSRHDVEKLMDYLKANDIQTFTLNRPFQSETHQARDFFAEGTKYFDKADSFKTFSRTFRKTTFSSRTTKNNTRRAYVESEPESESETEPHYRLSDSSDSNNDSNEEEDEDIGVDIFDIDDYASDSELPANEFENVIRNLAQVAGL